MINIPVTLDIAQRTAIMKRIRTQWPATQGTTQAISDAGRFVIRPVREAVTLPADLTEAAVRSIVLEVLETARASRPGTFQTTRTYDRGGQRTLKPYHPSRKH